jgi:hypothetical protein
VLQQTDIRAGGHECFDRVVLTFDVEAGPPDGTASYEIGYRSPPSRTVRHARPRRRRRPHRVVLFGLGRTTARPDSRPTRAPRRSDRTCLRCASSSWSRTSRRRWSG